MEESKIIENHENLPADKVKAPSASSEIKESFSYKPSDPDEVPTREGIPSAEREPEAKKPIIPAAVADLINQEQKLYNETVPVRTPNVEQNHNKPQKEETNSKENQTDTSLKSQAQDQKQNEAKDSAAPKIEKQSEGKDSTAPKIEKQSEGKDSTAPKIEKKQNEAKNSTAAKTEKNESNSKTKDHQTTETKTPIEDPQVEGKTEAAQEQKDSKNKDKDKDTKLKKSQAVKDKKTKSKKLEIKEAPAKKPEEKPVDSEQMESFRKDSAKENQLEEERRKNWRSLLAEVSLVSSLSAFKLLYDKSSTSESKDASARKRTAKKLYKKKMQILKENYTYRLGLLKQLKAAMRDKFNSEAQQLYSDYTSFKRKHGYRDTNNTNSKDSAAESQPTVSSEDPVALATLG